MKAPAARKPKASGLAKAKAKASPVARARGLAIATRATAKAQPVKPARRASFRKNAKAPGSSMRLPDVGKAVNDFVGGIRSGTNLGPGIVNQAMTKKK